MSTIGNLVDRLVERLVPRMTAHAACLFRSEERTTIGTCPIGTETGALMRITTHYHDCPSKSRIVCVY
jgi:hypothetical protein